MNQVIARQTPPSSTDPLARLSRATDVRFMSQLLSERWRWAIGRGWSIQKVEVHRVFPRGEDRFVVKYHVVLSDGANQREQTLFGELQPGDAVAARAMVLDKLRKSRRKQIDRLDDSDAIEALPELGMLLRIPGYDEKLPGLTLLHQPKRARRFFKEHLPKSWKPFAPEPRLQILNHRPAKRCVMRGWVDAEATRSVVLRSLNDKRRRHQDNLHYMQMLWQAGFDDAADDGIRIPRPLFCDDRLATIVIEDIPGAAMLNGDSGLSLSRESALAGETLAKLHDSQLLLPTRYGADEELAMLEKWIVLTRRLRPDLATMLTQKMALVRRQLDRLPEVPACPVHRDYYGKQLLFDGQQTILIDFDTLCMGDPAIDIGNYLAHRRFEILSDQLGWHDASTCFIAGYDRRRRPPPAEAITAWENAALLRLACLYALHTGWESVPSALLTSIRG